MADTHTDDIRADGVAGNGTAGNGSGVDGRQLQTRRQSPSGQPQPQRQARSNSAQNRSAQREVPRAVSSRPAPASQNGAALAYRARPRGLWGQITSVLLQPAAFFRSLPAIGDTRQWLWVMIIILALTGIVAVREQALLAEAEAGGGVSAFPPDMGGGGAIPEGDFGGGGVIEGDPGIGGEFGPPPGFDAGGGAAGGAAETSVTANLTTALLAASNILIGWGFLIVLLCEVSLFNGRAPRLGQNFHIAIWATVPLAVMAGLKLLFYASGGEVGQGGIAGIVTEMPFYAGLSGFAQSLTLSLASRLTLFWLWSLILIYFGARYALNGKRAAALLVVVMWVVVLVVAPVATGAINATAGLTTETITPEGMEGMPDGMSPEGGDFSGLMGEAGMPEGMEIIPGEFSEGEVQELPEGFSSDSESEGSEVINGAATGELSGAEGEAPEDETVTDEISSGGGGGGGSASGGGSSAGGASGGGGGSSAPAPSVNVEPAQSEAEAAPPPARSMKG